MTHANALEVSLPYGDVGSGKSAAKRFIINRYGQDAVEIIDAVCQGREHGGVWRWLVTYNLDHDKAKS